MLIHISKHTLADKYMYTIHTSRDLRGLGRRSPKFEVWGWPMHPSPKYFENYCYRMWGKVRTE